MGDSFHFVVKPSEFELKAGAQLHRFNNNAGKPWSAIYVNGEEIWNFETSGEAKMIDHWNAEGYKMFDHKRIRGFEPVKHREGYGIRLPQRSTSQAAGYDFFAIEDITIPAKEIRYVQTGVKAYMPKGEVLVVCNRSSNPKKKGLVLINGIGIVDSDYYNNEDNDGEIGFAFYNLLDYPITITRGERLGQGIFTSFHIADGDSATAIRKGGFGSTGR
jgi:dUTP pyrophosphatase